MMTKTTPLTRLLSAAKKAGCSREQMRLFLEARYIPQPRQLVFHGMSRLADEPDGPTEIGFGGARGPGKTHAIICQMAIDDCQRRAGLRCLLLRKVGKAARATMEHMRQKALLGVTHEWVSSQALIRFPNDSSIVLGHFQYESDVDAYLGLEYDVIAIEEATTLTLSKYKAIRTVNRTSLAGWRPRIYSSTNPGGIGHGWYKNRFVAPYRTGTETGTRFIPATVDDNKFLNKEYKNQLEELTGWMLRAWRYGDWDIAAGQYFVNFRQDQHIIKPAYPSLALYGRFWCALDYGFTHYTSVHLFGETGDGHVHILDEHCERRWLVPRHAQAIRAMLYRNRLEVKELSAFVAGRDVFAVSRGGARTIAEQYADEGLPLTAANMNRIDGATELLRRIGGEGQPHTLGVYERCARLIACLPILQHDPARPEDVLKVDSDSESGEGGDDPYDSGRYGIMEATSRKKAGIQLHSYSGRKDITKSPVKRRRY